MFAKIRNGAPNMSNETVALAMVEAKRNGIPDVDRWDKLASQTARYGSAASRRDVAQASKRMGRRLRCKTRSARRRRLASITSCNRPKSES